MRRHLFCKLHGGLSHLLLAGTARHRSIASYIADDRDLCLPLIRRPRWGSPRQNIAMTFGTQKLEWCG